MRIVLTIGLAFASLIFGSVARAESTGTAYTIARDVDWLPATGNRLPAGSFYAIVRGKAGAKCDWMELDKFPDGFVYPWHVNHAYLLFTVLKGTLVIGFDQHHLKSAERALPAGSIMQGLATEPHYGRAIGETIFEIYAPCPKV